VGTTGVEKVHELFEINKDTIELIKKKARRQPRSST
jgi:hypothetical protein